MTIADPIRPRRAATLVVGWLLALTLAALSSCGGGGGGGGDTSGTGGSSSSSSASSTSQPTILASVITFPTGGVPPGFLPGGQNSAAAVQITDQGGTPIASASVTIDSTALSYVAADQEYEGALNLNPGDTVTLTAVVNGTSYTVSHTNFSTYPAIAAPAAGSTWSSDASNLVSWSGAVPDSTAQYAVGVLTPTGTIVWPAGGSLQPITATDNSTTLSANSLTAGNYLVLVGIVDGALIPGAANGSTIAIGGFNYVSVTVSNATAATPQALVTSPTTATVGVGKAAQLSAKATYTDGTTRDVTTQANWSSSDTTKVTVNASGAVTGVAGGTASVTAQYAGLSASTTVTVFAPNPSPTPPLSQSVAYQIDYAHSGGATVGGSGPTFPPTAHWSTTLSGSSISYPVIAGGKVFVTTDATPAGQIYGTTLYALDETTGNSVWGPTPLSGTYSFSGIAYDHGTLFVINFDGLLRTFDAATGTPGWSLQIPGMSQVTSPPTAVNGIVYVNGYGGGLVAIDESNGSVLAAGPYTDHSSPAVSADGVFLSGTCDAYKLDPFSAVVLWHFAEACSGGGGKTVAYANNKAYVRDLLNTSANNGDVDLVLDAGTGTQLGSFNSNVIPAFSSTTGFFMTAGTLTATDSSTGATLWTFTGDGNLISAPIVIDNVVVIGSSSGTVYALDAASGNVLWSGSAGAAIAGPDEQNATLLTGLGAGEGYLVVPAGNVLNGWRIIP